ncbi:MAG: metallophosphoesterase [Thermincola sp.]|jgi:predicted MPP superfamily phosphohydrolase|nr:metallophosphoesterase [Thermincola sp.]MDT3704636.1 metallophosphoesterase [Thermincola sp.]
MSLIRKYAVYFLIPLFAIMGVLIFVNLFAKVDFNLQALQANLSVRSSYTGFTTLRVTPVGEVRAQTHKTPLSVTISLENIDPDRVENILSGVAEQDTMVNEAKAAILGAVRRLVVLTMGLGFGGGLFGMIILQRRSWKEVLLGGLIGLVTASVLLFGTYKTFEIQKFQNPEYDGIIKAAPWMIKLAQDSYYTVNTLGVQMRSIADNLNGLFHRVSSLQAMDPGDGEIKILHVSDIHNNPVAFEFIDQVVKTFGINLVIDSGDISDFGTPLESALVGKIKSLQVPYIITPGNHETPSMIKGLQEIPNVTVLEAGIKKIDGVNIAGIGDPASLRNETKAPVQSEINAFTGRLKEIIEAADVRPDIVVAHNPKIAGKFWGQIPVVLTGHMHKYEIKTKPNSVFINAGTSGAAGIGGLETANEVPYTFVLLHFNRSADGLRLKYTDTIRISNQQSGYSLERKLFLEPLKPVAVPSKPDSPV